MRRPNWIYAAPVLIMGLLSGQTLAAQAQATTRGATHGTSGHGTMTGMANCPMMTAMMRGPDAALSKRKALGLSAAQVNQLETLRATETRAIKPLMDSMMALHKQLATLSDAPQFDENAVRGLFDRMGALHTTAGTAMLRAQHDAGAVLTPEQGKKLAADNGMMGMMNMSGMAGKGMMHGDTASMMSMMMSMSGCPMMSNSDNTRHY